jgi:hypothetical protein
MKNFSPNACGNVAFDGRNHTKARCFVSMRNFYAWQESAYESRTLTIINVLANNLINRIWGEVWTVVSGRAPVGVRFFYAWKNYPCESST